MDRSRILRELATAEKSIQVAKEIASSPGKSVEKKRRED
jgi:hypothetical protein